jgi:tetratricopeptide (TPR) repeat protein
VPLALCAGISSAQDYRAIGDTHFYNLRFDQAIAAYSSLIAHDPSDALAYADLGSAILYQELHRLGRLDASAYADGNRFVREQRAKPSSEALTRLTRALDEGQARAQARLAGGKRDDVAHYALCRNATVRATAALMLEKAWVATMRNGMEAKTQCEQVRRSNPDFADAYLILGMYEYGVASLPRSVRWMFAVGGLHGTKQKGLEYAEMAATRGIYAKTGARTLLAVLYRREKRFSSAEAMLEGLRRDYPANYIFALDLASVYSQAGDRDRSLAILKSLIREDTDAAQIARIPPEAIERRVREMEGTK